MTSSQDVPHPGIQIHGDQAPSHSDQDLTSDLINPSEEGRASEERVKDEGAGDTEGSQQAEAQSMEEVQATSQADGMNDVNNPAEPSPRVKGADEVEGTGKAIVSQETEAKSKEDAQATSQLDEKLMDDLINPPEESRGSERAANGTETAKEVEVSPKSDVNNKEEAQAPSQVDEQAMDLLVAPPEESRRGSEAVEGAEEQRKVVESETKTPRRNHVEIDLNDEETRPDGGVKLMHKAANTPNGTSHQVGQNGIVSADNSQSRISRAAKQVDELCTRSPHAAARYNTLSKLRKHIEEQRFNTRDASGFTPLHFAACYGHAEAVGLLLQAKALVNEASQQGWSPLHVASRNGHHRCIVELLEAGSNLGLEDKLGMTALHNASCCVTDEGHKCVQELLQRGANVNQLDADGWTPLHFAARFNNVSAVLKLLEHNADPNKTDRDRWTPLHNSARNGRNRCVQELLDHGADLFLTTRYGETALHIACRKGKSKVVEKIMNGVEKLGSGKLTKLLSLTDIEGRTPEDVASSEYIRSLLRRETRRGSSYDFVPELTKAPSFDASRVKKKKGSAACTIL